ncbi:Os10g0184250, partial [Oryza sativa Japonica Group]
SERASGAYVFELEEAEVAEVGDGEVRGLRRDDDLHQLHRLRPHQIHRRAAPAAAARHRGGPADGELRGLGGGSDARPLRWAARRRGGVSGGGPRGGEGDGFRERGGGGGDEVEESN